MIEFDNNPTKTPFFNMTPIIDIVFLLIIFFMLVCQFIVAENFEVTVPEDIASAKPADTDNQKTTTVTVMYDNSGQVVYAVGSEIIATHQADDTARQIAAAIDKQLKSLPKDRRVVSFRNDKDILFKYTKHALAGISQSSATDIKWAVTKNDRLENL